jgi:hypothetical protein
MLPVLTSRTPSAPKTLQIHSNRTGHHEGRLTGWRGASNYLHGIVERDDVGVVDAAKDVDLGKQALTELAAEPIHGDLLHCHLRVPNHVPPQEHLRVRPRPDRPQQLVLPHHAPPPPTAGAGAVPHRAPAQLVAYLVATTPARPVCRRAGERCRRGEKQPCWCCCCAEQKRGGEARQKETKPVVFTSSPAGPAQWLSLSAVRIRFRCLSQDSPYVGI